MVNREITSQDVLNLIEAKAQDPHISMAEIFRKVDSVKPNYNKQMWKVFWIPMLFYIISIMGMLFFTNNLPWWKLSLIVFILATIGCCYTLSNYKKKWWWVIIVTVFIIYIVLSDKPAMEELLMLMKSIVM